MISSDVYLIISEIIKIDEDKTVDYELKDIDWLFDTIEEKERVEKERVEKERIEKERIEKERIEKERIEKERIEKERIEKERIEKERVEKERVEKERIEKERVKKERVEKERVEKERVENEVKRVLKLNFIKDKLEKSCISKIDYIPFLEKVNNRYIIYCKLPISNNIWSKTIFDTCYELIKQYPDCIFYFRQDVAKAGYISICIETE